MLTRYQCTEIQQALDRLVEQHNYDLVLFESIFLAGHRLPTKLPFVIDQHNIEFQLLARIALSAHSHIRRWYTQWESRRLKPVEIDRCRRAACVLTTSEQDQRTLQAFLPSTSIVVVPNGIDTERYSSTPSILQITGRIVFTGTMNYYPNCDAAVFFARYCWPFIRAKLPHATWYIVGHHPPVFVQRLSKLPGVTVTGSVADTRTYLAQAQLVVVPLRMGGGTRIKILEDLAMEKAVVSTPLGCEGLSITAGRHLIVSPLEEFAGTVVALLKDQAQRVQCGTAGRRLVEDHYDWKQCRTPMLDALERIERRG